MCELESAENVWFGILVLYDLWKRRLFCRPLLRDGVDAGTPTAGIVNIFRGCATVKRSLCGLLLAPAGAEQRHRH